MTQASLELATLCLVLWSVPEVTGKHTRGGEGMGPERVLCPAGAQDVQTDSAQAAE